MSTDSLSLALELWKEVLVDDPWINNDYGDTYCFFCGEDYPFHHVDCPYEKAKSLIQK